jgi:hypothetical protein
MPATARAARDAEAMTDAELVEAALEKFANATIRPTARRFAEDIIGCDESSLRRWRHGQQAMNAKRRRWFINFLKD